MPGYPERMRGLVSLVVCILGVASTGASPASPQATTTLRITYWEDGSRTAASESWTLRCDPPRGTLPQPARACKRLFSSGARMFAPTPQGIACTEIYGGPQKARVVGIVAGDRVWATFARADGCQIARWNRITPWLVPPGGVT